MRPTTSADDAIMLPPSPEDPPPSYQQAVDPPMDIVVNLYRYAYVHTSTTTGQQRTGPCLETKKVATTITRQISYKDFILATTKQSIEGSDTLDVKRFVFSVVLRAEGHEIHVDKGKGNGKAVKTFLMRRKGELFVAMAPAVEDLGLEKRVRCWSLRVGRRLKGVPKF